MRPESRKPTGQDGWRIRVFFLSPVHRIPCEAREARRKGRDAEMNEMTPSAHRMELTDRETLTVSGVENVERFDENSIVMSTSAGVLLITGSGLHIGQLSLDGGELHVDGRIDSLAYEDAAPERVGLFGRLFG